MATEGIRLIDPNGAIMDVMRVEDLALVFTVELATNEPFRMFEDNRETLERFLRRPLEG